MSLGISWIAFPSIYIHKYVLHDDDHRCLQLKSSDMYLHNLYSIGCQLPIVCEYKTKSASSIIAKGIFWLQKLLDLDSNQEPSG